MSKTNGTNVILSLLNKGEITKVVLPKGEVDSIGLSEIDRYLAENGYPILPESFPGEWVIRKGKYAGTLPKRVSTFLYKEYGIRLVPSEVSQIGNLAKQYSSDQSVYYVDFTTDLDWNSGDFGDSDSCFWTSNEYARELLKHNDAIAFRLWADDALTAALLSSGRNPSSDKLDEDEKNSALRSYMRRCASGFGKKGFFFGYGRSWLLLDQLDLDMFLIFNAYPRNLRLLQHARLLGSLTGFVYEQIKICQNSSTTDPLFINADGNAYLLRSPSTDSPTENRPEGYFFELGLKEKPFSYCSNCDKPLYDNDLDDGECIVLRSINFPYNSSYLCYSCTMEDNRFTQNGCVKCGTMVHPDDYLLKTYEVSLPIVHTPEESDSNIVFWIDYSKQNMRLCKSCVNEVTCTICSSEFAFVNTAGLHWYGSAEAFYTNELFDSEPYKNHTSMQVFGLNSGEYLPYVCFDCMTNKVVFKENKAKIVANLAGFLQNDSFRKIISEFLNRNVVGRFSYDVGDEGFGMWDAVIDKCDDTSSFTAYSFEYCPSTRASAKIFHGCTSSDNSIVGLILAMEELEHPVEIAGFWKKQAYTPVYEGNRIHSTSLRQQHTIQVTNHILHKGPRISDTVTFKNRT